MTSQGSHTETTMDYDEDDYDEGGGSATPASALASQMGGTHLSAAAQTATAERAARYTAFRNGEGQEDECSVDWSGLPATGISKTNGRVFSLS